MAAASAVGLLGHRVLHRRVSEESVAIAFLCLLDLITTLYWVSQGQAREGNPLLAYFLDMGAPWFIAVKVLTFAPALTLAEWYRQHKPELVTRLLRWVAASYVVLYIAGILAHRGQVVDFYARLLS